MMRVPAPAETMASSEMIITAPIIAGFALMVAATAVQPTTGIRVMRAVTSRDNRAAIVTAVGAIDMVSRADALGAAN